MTIEKIVSGGQTGVDRAVLDSAIALNIPHGGWCPKGRKAEDGVIARCYSLKETSSDEYAQRTIWNVVDSDATLIILDAPPMRGTLLTEEAAVKFNKPCLIVDLSKKPNIEEIVDWIIKSNIKVLNIGGPRESQSPGIYEKSADIIKQVLIHPLIIKKMNSI